MDQKFQEVNSLKTKKSPGYDLITGKILKELPIVGLKYFTVIQRRHAKRTLLGTMESCTDHLQPKTRKPPNELTSYRPISLFAIISKTFEKVPLKEPPPNG
jgi:hypothetical protein